MNVEKIQRKENRGCFFVYRNDDGSVDFTAGGGVIGGVFQKVNGPLITEFWPGNLPDPEWINVPDVETGIRLLADKFEALADASK